MVRLAANTGLAVDSEARLGGRGGYLHRREECLAMFERSRVKEFRSLRRSVALDDRRRITKLIRNRLDSKAEVE
jgi:predicted RNA-binding protein YlxR (DUF448 family)